MPLYPLQGLPAAAAAPSATSGSGSSDAAAAAAQPKSPLLSPAVLVRLVQKGDVARLKQALELGADPNTADNGKITLLMHATRYNHPHIVQLLIDTGRCDLELRNMQGQTALHDSAATGRLNIAHMKRYMMQGHLCLADAKLRHRLLCQELSAWFAQQASAEVGEPDAACKGGTSIPDAPARLQRTAELKWQPTQK